MRLGNLIVLQPLPKNCIPLFPSFPPSRDAVAITIILNSILVRYLLLLLYRSMSFRN
jgi:hypothetical protein